MVKVKQECVVNGVKYAPGPKLHHEGSFGPYLYDLRDAGALEVVPETAEEVVEPPKKASK